MGDYERALVELDRAVAVEPNDWRLYTRILAYRLLGKEEAAAVGLAAAIAEAQATETKTRDNWQNRLNLALNYIASGDAEAAQTRYKAAIAAGIHEGLARDATQDLDSYLQLFPEDKIAREARLALRQYLEERFQAA